MAGLGSPAPFTPFPAAAVVVATAGITSASFAPAALDTPVWGATTRSLTDKAGFTLTAGSYSVRASSTQRGTITFSGTTSGTLAISSVTTTRARETFTGHTSSQTTSGLDIYGMRARLSNSTTVTGNTATNANLNNMDVTVQELL